MIKLPENTSPEFVSQLANELSSLLKDKYNKPIKSGKLINDLSVIFGAKNWNTLSAQLNSVDQQDFRLLDILSKDLLIELNLNSLKIFLSNKRTLNLLKSGEASELYDLIYYHFSLENNLTSYCYQEDENLNDLIPSSYKNQIFDNMCESYEINPLSSSSFADTDSKVSYRAIQEMMKDLLCSTCRCIEEHYDGDFKEKIPSEHIVEQLQSLLTNKKFIRKQF